MSEKEYKIGSATIRFRRGDITEMATDAIVNAANSSLMGGGGVDGAIHRKGGPQILEECKRIRAEQWPGGLPTGKAVITSGGNLKAEHVIHTVGPIWRGGNKGEAELLKEAYINSLKIAGQNGVRAVAFPSISTGIYGYPVEEAARIALRTAADYLEKHQEIKLVRFVLFDSRTYQTYEAALKELVLPE